MLRQFRFSLPLVILSCVGGLPASSQDHPTSVPLDPQMQSQLGELAGRVLSHSEKVGCEKKSCAILVSNFTGPSGGTTLLGMQLADALSAELAHQARDIQIVDRSRLQGFLEQERIPSKFLEDDRAAGWLASRLSASTVVVGSLKNEKTRVHLRVQLLNAKDAVKKKHGKGSYEEMVFSLLDAGRYLAPSEPFGVIPHLDAAPQGEKIFRAGMDGTTMPSCYYTPDPPYSDEGRAVKFQGKVLLEVTITLDQRISDIHVVQGAPFGLSDAALRTVVTWKCKPASFGGTPVPTRVPIEITFRLF
ncbi:MAG: hypothetical protein PVS2B2_23330 [Candidatus Acidiferrum sp.]